MFVSEGSERVETATLQLQAQSLFTDQFTFADSLPDACRLYLDWDWSNESRCKFRTGQTLSRQLESLALAWAQALALARTHRVTHAPLRGAHLRVRAPSLEDERFTVLLQGRFT